MYLTNAVNVSLKPFICVRVGLLFNHLQGFHVKLIGAAQNSFFFFRKRTSIVVLCAGHIRLFFRQNRIYKTIAYAYKHETNNNKKVVESIGPTVFVDNDLKA